MRLMEHRTCRKKKWGSDPVFSPARRFIIVLSTMYGGWQTRAPRHEHVLFTGRLSNLFDKAGHNAQKMKSAFMKRWSAKSHPSFAVERRSTIRWSHVIASSAETRWQLSELTSIHREKHKNETNNNKPKTHTQKLNLFLIATCRLSQICC